jgi:glutamate---cysteine ligase / carboxylate-amine ligase
MPVKADEFTIGVEEEYQIINPETRELRPRVSRLLPKAREDLGDEVTNELYP